MEKALRLAGGTHTVADVVEALNSGRMQGFWSENAGVVTQVVQHPRKKELNVFLAFGDLGEVMAMQPQIADFGRQHGCSFMVMSGRTGWKKVLPEHGWSQVGVTYALPLEN
jgi:hypothetical protein